jgi:hypothetical protein
MCAAKGEFRRRVHSTGMLTARQQSKALSPGGTAKRIASRALDPLALFKACLP